MGIDARHIRKFFTAGITQPVHIAPLASFRILFGAMILFSSIRFVSKGWVDELYVKPVYFFTYYGFDWIHPFSRTGMYVVFGAMILSALCVMMGFFYRIAALLFFLCFTYVELLDKTNYLNHYYFVSLISLFLVLLPANKFASLDIKLGIAKKVTHIPAWCINIIKAQIGLVYFFAGIAKINGDWLLRAQPLKIWLAGRDQLPVIGPLFNIQAVPYLFSWFGMLFDISIVFFLLNSKTRPYAYIAVVVFHALTGWLFQIGVFPYVMMVATWIFFSENFHRRLLAVFSKEEQEIYFSYPKLLRPLLLVFFTLHFLLQLLLPVRYVFYPGKLFWTEEGYRFSWRVMLMEKNGYTNFVVKDKTGKIAEVNKSAYLSPQQEKMMNTQPDMILQFAHHIAGEYGNMGYVEPQVYVDSYVSLNGRRSRPFISADVDLAAQRENFCHKKWILPFEEK